MFKHKLSIITINYNNVIGVEETIKSIVNQDFQDFEYIIIDGASTDGSSDLIKTYDKNISYWISEPDSGIYNAMNKGITQAKGEYVLFINSGDTLYGNTVLSDVFSHKLSSDLIYGDLHRTFPDGTEDVVKMPESLSFYDVFYGTLAHPTAFIKRSLFQDFGLYREDLRIVSDWAFFFKIITFANPSRTHISIVIASFGMDGLSANNEGLVVSERQKVLRESLSSELIEMSLSYPGYKAFYNRGISKLIRKGESLYRNFFSLRSWTELIHKKRYNKLIWVINKTVRKQKRDPLSIPIVIINYNRLTDLKNLVSFLQERKHKNIVIVDNKSTYPPLLEYYNQIKDKVTVEYMTDNCGHLVFWRTPRLHEKYAKGYYIVTDSDILPNANLPQDYLRKLYDILDHNKNVSKVGFALRIDDIPDHYAQKDKVLEWEQQFWEQSISPNLYAADLDTTFAMYPPYYKYTDISDFYKGIRLGGDFTARHEGWYSDSNNQTDEEVYYKKHANKSNNW